MSLRSHAVRGTFAQNIYNEWRKKILEFVVFYPPKRFVEP